VSLGLYLPSVSAQQPAIFPQVIAVGASSQPLTVQFPLPQGGNIAKISAITDGSEGFDFTNAGGGTCTAGISYLPGQQCSVSVGFNPTSPGQRLGAIVLLDGNGRPVATQFLLGNATGPLAVFVPGAINTVAGDSAWIFSGDGSAATQSALFLPFGLAVNARGDLFIADSSNNRIRKVDGVTGILSTVAGNGLVGSGGNGGPAVLASLSNPSSIALDPAGNLYFADSGNNLIRRIDAFTGIITTVAGTVDRPGYSGDSGPAILASLNTPNGIAFAPNGNLYIADTGNNVIRLVTAATGIISTVAGTGVASFSGDGAPAIAATFSNPWSITLAPTGQLYIADQNNQRIRMVDNSGIVTTVAGTGISGFSGDGGPAAAALLNVPASVAVDVAGNLYVADSGNNRVRKISAQTRMIVTVAGSNSQSFNGDSGPANLAGLYGPYTLALDGQGNLFIADVFHNRIRKVSSNAAALDFQPMRVNRVSAPMSQTLEDDGNAPLSLENILAVTNAQLDGPTTTCSPSVMLNVFDSCIVGVAFAPTATGLVVTGTVNEPSNASNSPGVISLIGQVLDVDPASVTLTSSLNPSTVGQSITFTATASSAGTTPTGTASLLDGATTLSAASLQNGIANFTLSSLAGGQHSMTVSYSGDSSNSAAVSQPLIQVVKDIQAPTVTTLTSNVNPVNAGAPLSLIAGVTVATPGAGTGTITGSVTFIEGTTILGAATIVSGTATLTVSTLAVGSHTIIATYSSNNNYAASISASIVQRVQLATSRIAVTASANPSNSGAALTLSAILLSNGGVPTGTVVFSDGAISLGSATINGQGIATLLAPGSIWTVGTHTLTATYAGDQADSGSTSQPLSEIVNIATTSVTLSSSLNPAALGGQVIFTAAVSGNGGTPSGSVQFFDGATALGAGTLNHAATATLILSTLTLGSHEVTALYSGDSFDAPATSAALSEIVQKASIAINLTSSANPSNFGTPLIVTANVSGSGSQPTGSVTFTDTAQAGSTVLAAIPLGSNGVATFTSGTLPIGPHNIVAQYSGDANHSAIVSSLLAQRILQTTTTGISASSTQSIAGLAVNFLATVTGANGNAVTGNVTFFDGPVTLATQPTDANGIAHLTSTALTPGQHNIVATYMGDALDATSASSAAVEIVAIAQTSATLSSSANPAFSGTAVVLASTVTGNGAVPAGTVTFHDGSTVLSIVPLSAGAASLTVSTLAPGIHLLSASYSGDANDQAAISATLSQQIVEKTTITLGSSANPSLLTDGLTLTVSVGNGTPVSPPTGSVVLTDNGAPIATLSINSSGMASLTLTSPTLGLHTLIATYAGDNNNTAATTQPFLQNVVLRPTSTSFTSSSSALSAGQQLIFTTIVQGAGPRPATGQVSFQSGTTILGTAQISPAGIASLTFDPNQGAYNVVALYAGDSLYASSVSPAIIVTVGPPVEFTITTQPTLQLQSGQHATMQIAIASAPTFTDVLALGCAGLPASATCTFSTDQLAVSAGLPKILSVTIDTGNPLGAGASAQLSSPGSLPASLPARDSVPFAAILPAGVLLALLRRRVRKAVRHIGLLTSLLFLATLGAASILSGCASNFSTNDTPPGSYTFQIVATGNQTAATQAATVQLTVTQ